MQAVEIHSDHEFYGLTIRFEDRTALTFTFETAVFAFPTLADWEDGNETNPQKIQVRPEQNSAQLTISQFTLSPPLTTGWAVFLKQPPRCNWHSNKLTKGILIMNYEAIQDKKTAGEWRVEAIDFENEGAVHVVIFSGPDAKERAEEYAHWKNDTKQRRLPKAS